MFLLRDQVLIHAPVERCFGLSTSIAVVQRELKMRPVAGRTSGHVQAGDTVLWKGWQLGLPQMHQSLIRNFVPNQFFQDRMLRGRFASFEHDHEFLDNGDGDVLLRDELRFTMPFGWLGSMAGRVILVPHIRALMHRRFALIKSLAEGDGWRQYLDAPVQDLVQGSVQGAAEEQRASSVAASSLP